MIQFIYDPILGLQYWSIQESVYDEDDSGEDLTWLPDYVNQKYTYVE